jgi:uncharacterized membrane protein YhaH (DUF805 family)
MASTMTPVDWAKRPIEKYADFGGRASRAEYWWYTLAIIILGIVVSIIENMVGLDNWVGMYGPIALLLMLALLVPGLAVTVRRLHDTDRSGWWMLIALIPYGLLAVVMGMSAASGSLAMVGLAGIVAIVALIGVIALLVFMIMPGTPGDNRYGPPPADGAAATA